MIRWVAGLARRAGGTFLLLLMLLCGAEVALRLADLRTSQSRVNSRRASVTEPLTVPSWTTYCELRPSAAIRVQPAESSESHVVRTNSFGIRGPEPDTPKPRDRYRVLCLGDERLLAAQLAEEDHLASQLERRLQPATKLEVEVWNAGVPGACPLTQFLLLTHRLTALQPDLVLCFLHADDLARDQAYRRLTRIDRQGRPLACRHPTLGRTRPSSALAAWRQEFRLIDSTLNWAGATWKEKTSFDPALQAGALHTDFLRLQHDRTVVDRTFEPLAWLSNWCRDSYVAQAVVLVSESKSQSDLESPWLAALEAFAEERSLTMIHLVASEHADPADNSLGWTAQDHQDFAEEIARRVLADISGPWSSPYFQSEPRTITPTGHQTEFAPRQMIQRAEPTHRKY